MDMELLPQCTLFLSFYHWRHQSCTIHTRYHASNLRPLQIKAIFSKGYVRHDAKRAPKNRKYIYQRNPITLCNKRQRDPQSKAKEVSLRTGGQLYHLQSPHPPNPHFQPAIDPIDIVQLDPFPPASPRRFPPEQEQFLRHAEGVAVGEVVALDVGAQAGQRETADDGFVGLAGAVAPLVVVVEAPGSRRRDR